MSSQNSLQARVRRGSTQRYQPPHWLQVGPHRVWTTLSQADLENPDLWILRTPVAWAAALVQQQNVTARRPASSEGDPSDRPHIRGALTVPFNHGPRR